MAEKPDFFYEDFANGATIFGNWQGKVKVSLRAAITLTIKDIFNHVSGRRQMNLYHVTTFSLYLPLTVLWLPKTFSVSHYFIYNNCFRLFLSAYFLFLEILNLNLPFAVCRNIDSKSLCCCLSYYSRFFLFSILSTLLAALINLEIFDSYHNLFLLVKTLGLTYPTVKPNFKQDFIFKKLELLKYFCHYPRAGDSHMTGAGMHVVSLTGVNIRFWSCLGYSGQSTVIFSRKGLF